MKKYNPNYHIILLLFVLCTSSVFAQHEWNYIQIDSTKQKWGDWDEPDWLRYFGLDAGDIDGDGDLDIVSGRYLYHNPGNMTDSWERTILDDNMDVILFLDVDGDPYADLIAQALPNLYWLEAINEEGTHYKKHKIGEVPATGHVNSQGFEKAQIINGGPSEFVIAGNGDIYCIRIPDKDPDKKPWTIRKICENTSDEGIGIGDIDNDGYLDIAAGRVPPGEKEPKTLLWFKNPGTIDELWSEIEVGKSKHPIDRIKIADLNNDAKADIIITEERYPGLEPDSNMFWYQQNSSSNWERHRIVTQYSMNNLDVQDIDGDNDYDIITAEHKGKRLELQIWYNDGAANFSKNVIDIGKENHLGSKLKDLDGDGDLDIYGTGWDRYQEVHIWHNQTVRPLTSGDTFKEYIWSPYQTTRKNHFLRVGGKLDYRINSDHFPQQFHNNGSIPLEHELDLEHAIAAELIIERVQSHEDTKNLTISFNDHRPLKVPEPATLPNNATDYMFHANIRVPVPLNDLHEGSGNYFSVKVSDKQSWDWPQNLIYGVILKVYYSEDKLSTKAKRAEIHQKKVSKDQVKFSIKSPNRSQIVKVDYLGFYEDIDFQGNGSYQSWQYDYHQGNLIHHIGTSTTPPFEVTWTTEWIPNQQHPIQVMARITTKEGIVFLSKKMDGLVIERDYDIFLAKPYKQPAFWVTRNSEFSSYIDLHIAPEKILDAKIFWKSWSPCYNSGIKINDHVLKPDANLPCYAPFWHEKTLPDKILLKGANEITTLKTPLKDGKMVHGMEVQWPGIMVKIKSKKASKQKASHTIRSGMYENREHYIINTKNATYYYDVSGGGFSRIIDSYGNDWVRFYKAPWNKYPESAAASFRGVPNLVFGSENNGAGHPGFDRCTSQLINDTSIQSRTKDNRWEWRWSFHDSYAVLEMIKVAPNQPYWFLYEGTPGGKYDIENYYYGTDVSGPISQLPDFYKGNSIFQNIRWAYSGRSPLKNVFFMGQVTPDLHTDILAYLGNTNEGLNSKNGMTVFGFGRGQETNPLLKTPQKFVIGFYPAEISNRNAHHSASEFISRILKKHQ